jgi:anti-sigma-K factor RskA
VKLLREDMHALAGAYALDAVDGPERERFEHHLGHCQACDNEVRGLQETATRFALAVSEQPPAQLRTRVLASAARTRQPPPIAEVRSLPESGTGWLRRLAVPLAAACVVAAIALAVLLGMARSQLGSVRAEQREIAAVLSAPGARIVSVRISVGGAATVVVASRLHRLIFTSTGMPGLPAGKIYQLWVLGPGGSATSAGLLSQDANGGTTPVLASGLIRGDRIGVTVEPAGGTTKPTTTPIVVISLPS